MILKISIRKMTAWSPGPSLEEGASRNPDFEFFNGEKFSCKHINAAQGRRLSDLTKTSVDLALRTTETLGADHIIFSSRHGELSNSVQLLNMIGNKELLSPTLFSQSVHNTAIGTYTLIKKTKSPTTALSGGRDSFVMGLVSAQAYLNENPSHEVLYICADEKVPEIFSRSLTEANRAFAVAMLLNSKGQGSSLLVTSEPKNENESRLDKNPQGFEFINWFFSQSTSIRVEGEKFIWSLKKC